MAIVNPSTNNKASTAPQALTFPPQTFAKLSPSAYLTAHLNSPRGPLRPSGRKPSVSRPPTVHTGSLTHTHGSAVVRCGDTAVVCGIRGEILKVEDIADWESIRRKRKNTDQLPPETTEQEAPTTSEEKARQRRKQDTSELSHLNLLVPNLDLATGRSPAHLPNGPPSHLPNGPPSLLAQTLTQRIYTLLHTSQLLNIDDLRIWSLPPPAPPPPTTTEEDLASPQIKAFWTLYIDILFISLSGNPLDAAWFSLLAALQNVRLPRAWYDSDSETVFCSPVVGEARALTLYDIPVALSFGLFVGEGKGQGSGKGRGEKWILADPDGFEEGLCKESVTVVVGSGGRIVRIEKSGGGGVDGGKVRGLVELARGRREEWVRVLSGG